MGISERSPSREDIPPCVTRTLLLLLLTMAPACARLDSPEMTLPELSSPPLLDAPATRESWSVWDRRTPMSVTRPSPREVSSPQPQGQQGEDDPDHVRDLQHARHVRRHPGCALPVRLRTYHRYRHGLRRRCLPRRPRLRGLRSPPRHCPSGPGWP